MEQIAPQRISILDVPVDCIDMVRAVDVIDQAIHSDSCLTVIAVNPEKVMSARRDATTLQSLRQAGLLIPDGIGVVWAARLLTGQRVGRVAGADLMPEICRLAESRGYRVFLYGAAPGIAERASQVLLERYPGLQVAGCQHGYVDDDDMDALIDRINDSAADVLFVALGSPRQELWIKRHADRLGVKVYQGVGGTFNVLAGEVRRAPVIFRRFNLEWFYRLITDPRRLGRQMILPVFGLLVVWQKIRQTVA